MIILAILFLALAVVSLIAYNGTPHGGPTSVCSPIDVFGHTFSAAADCRVISIVEIAAAVVFFLLALLTALAARPRPRSG